MLFLEIFGFYLIYFRVVLALSKQVTIPGYYLWSYGEREKLYCPDSCKREDFPEECCSCMARPCWEFDKTRCSIANVNLEYLDIFGTSIVIFNNISSELIHTEGYLTRIPENICEMKAQLRKVDFRHNLIASISLLKCLTSLDTLRLDFNLIKYVENTTFSQMKDLRILTMSHNLITKLEPNTLIIEGGNIPIIDLSNNPKMDSLDFSNIFRPGPFCTLNFTNSSIEFITNELEIVMDKVIHGPGDILLEHTDLGSCINFTSVGITNMGDFGKYISGAVKIDSSSINCDCTVFPILSSLGTGSVEYWKNLESFICSRPESVKGLNLTEVAMTGNYDELTCDLSEKHTCPHYLCHCIDMPSHDKVLVNCTGVGLETMPDDVPIGAWNNIKVHLILADNNISVIDARKYYDRLIYLDLSGNPLSVYTKEAAGSIRAPINIENQVLVDLPPILQHRDPNMITFGPNPVTCNCSNTWIGDWIRLKKGYNRLNCSVDGSIMPAEDVYEHSLNCDKYTPISLPLTVSLTIGGLSAVLFGIGLIFYFHLEIVVLKRLFFRKQFSEESHKIDVFLSFYEGRDDVFRMVRRYIKPALTQAGYSVFIPWLDIQYGACRDDTITVASNQSVNFVIVLCDKYTEDYNSAYELETIWNSFKADNAKQIILINYDDVDSSEIRDNRLRALSRIRSLDFKIRNSELVNRLIGKLGKPLPRENEKKPNEENNVNNHEKIVDTDEVIMNDNRTVFDRLSMPRTLECSCKYRKCYLHNEPIVKRKGRVPSKSQVVPVKL